MARMIFDQREDQQIGAAFFQFAGERTLRHMWSYDIWTVGTEARLGWLRPQPAACYTCSNPRLSARRTASVRFDAPSLPLIDAT